jgi:hypothetical protein
MNTNSSNAREFTRPKPVYSMVKDFTDAQTGVTVRLQRSDDLPRPRYSMQIGRLVDPKNGDDLRLIPYLSIRVETQNGQVVRLTDYRSPLPELLAEAEEFVRAEAQLIEEELLARQIARDEERANQGKVVTRVTGKTQRDKAKKHVEKG